MSEWCAIYDTDEKRRAYDDEEQKYNKDKAEAEKRQQDTIQEAKRKYAAKQEAARKEAEAQRQREQAEAERDQAIKEADRYFKPYGYNSLSPTLYAGVRKLLWALKNRFDDRGSKEGQLLSDFFRKLGYIIADIDFPQDPRVVKARSTGPTNSKRFESTQVASTISTSPEVNLTLIPDVITSDKPPEEPPKSTASSSYSRPFNLSTETYLIDEKYGTAESDLIIAFASLIIVILLLAICLTFSLLIWVIKKCRKKEQESSDESEEFHPKKRESRAKTKESALNIDSPMKNVTKDAVPVKESLPSFDIHPKTVSKKDHSIVNMPEPGSNLIWTSNQQYDPKDLAIQQPNRLSSPVN